MKALQKGMGCKHEGLVPCFCMQLQQHVCTLLHTHEGLRSGHMRLFAHGLHMYLCAQFNAAYYMHEGLRSGCVRLFAQTCVHALILAMV